jgi:hypothetical protein
MIKRYQELNKNIVVDDKKIIVGENGIVDDKKNTGWFRTY